MIFTIVLIVVFIIVLLAFVEYRRRTSPPYEFIPNNKNLKPMHVKEQPTVLLLYARDCDKFTDVMAEFRYILKSALKCQVSDFGCSTPF